MGIAILVTTIAAFVGIGTFVAVRAVRIRWPSGKRVSRETALRIEVVVIDAPGATDGDKLILIDACACASTALLTAWRTWKVGGPTDVIDADQELPIIGVHFIDDELMDDLQHVLNRGEPMAAYLSDASSSFKNVPLAVIRKSLAGEMIATGQPLMHEILHALLLSVRPWHADYSMYDHTHPAWDIVQGTAVRTFQELYAPKTR